ncbi:HNH endonuclease family protein [Glutamicibacter mysorens]|uniref:HNH endonuclease family protein n=1 Tax=Glutamicibacter mysorens TaxID=257984 RepID=UPI0020C714BB|nr:HNH endonuclease family protein [Glutamicibacter mysorens]UTM48566.1 HNH endonuclease family protein [Glutamicibacter mysorens]
MRLLRRTLAFFTLVSTLVLSSCTSLDSAEFPPLPDAQGAPAPSTAVQREIYAESLELLDEIAVKGRAPKTGYDRAKFGKGWKDPDRNGCDARNDILSRDLVDVTYKSAARPCVVLRGRLDDPYTGKTIEFKRGQGTSTAVQIDHVVALSDSWQKGAQSWDADTRLEFANDPLNLLASDGPTNAAKGDKDAASWLPPNKNFRCDYVSRQTQVKAKYGVWMTKAEHAVIGKLLNSCI